MKYQTIIDDTTTANITYICKADLGRAETDSFWQITAIDTTTNTVIKYPQRADWFPSDDFIFKASERASLTYSLISS